MPRIRKRGFHWIPPDRRTKWSCTIAETDVTNFILNGDFPHGLISEELLCEIELDNSGEDFTDKFKARDEIIFNMDFSDGTTVKFKGELEEALPKDQDGQFKLSIKGAHFTTQWLDVMVSEEYVGAKISDIRKDLIDKYAPDFTYANIEENEDTTDMNFIRLSLLDCFLKLDIEGDEDTFIDFDKDISTFKRESKENDDEAVVWNDSLLLLNGLGTDSAEVRNKIQVLGEVDGLAVIYEAEDASSQTTYRAKEQIITDNSVIDEDQAANLANAETELRKNPKVQGSAECLFMPKLIPGYMTWVVHPPQNIQARYRPVKFVYHVPNEQTTIFFNQERSIPKLFKDRMKKEQSQEKNVNPFKMKRSYLFPYNNESKTDTASTSNITFKDGKIRKTTGAETGVWVSKVKISDIDATSMSLEVIGEDLEGATYEFQADSKADPQSINPNATSATSVLNKGIQIKCIITITSVNTRIDTLGLYWKN